MFFRNTIEQNTRAAFLASVLCCYSIITLLVAGCNKQLSNDEYRQYISFAVSNDSRVYFTDNKGVIKQLTRDGSISELPINGAKHRYHQVTVSALGAMVAAVFRLETNREDQVCIFTVDDSGATCDATFPGSTPCLSANGAFLFYSRANRFVEKRGFGGGFFTDYQLWQYDLLSKQHKQLSSRKYFVVDDIAHDAARNSLLFSAIELGDGRTVEQIFKIDLESGDISFNTREPVYEGQVLAGDPGFSHDFKKLIFISDRRRPFHYEVIEQAVDSDQYDVLVDGKDIRFCVHPSYDQNEDVFFLGAKDFSYDGRPIFMLFRRQSNGELNVVLSVKDFYGDSTSVKNKGVK